MGVSRYTNRIFVVSVIVDKGRFRIGIGRNIDCSADAVTPEYSSVMIYRVGVFRSDLFHRVCMPLSFDSGDRLLTVFTITIGVIISKTRKIISIIVERFIIVRLMFWNLIYR